MLKYTEAEQEVMDTHQLFWQAYADRDINRRLSVCSDDITFIGTGLHERAKDKMEYRGLNESGVQQFPDPFQIRFLWTNLSMFNNVACVESEVIWSQKINGKISNELVRNTTLFKFEANKWWVVHVHGSVPDYRLTKGDFMTNEKTVLRNRELEQQVFERTRELNKSLEDLKSTQSQLIQSEKMASLGELTAGIAHEIQNPLNFVNNFSEVNIELIEEMKAELKAGNNDDAIGIANDVADNERKINHHGKRADAIVKGMLQHSRSSNGVKEPTDINALADEYLRLAYHGLRAKDKSFNATLKTDFDETIGKINIIPQDIGRVILNLITNAFYAVDEKKKQKSVDYEPTVSVSTSRSLSSGEGRGEVSICVKDNGNGIPQKVLDKIFQPFFTTKPTGEGTGLGLSLSYDIIKAHGGELKVETKENEGAEFIIQLNTM
jgi:signal transduction histidine kinase